MWCVALDTKCRLCGAPFEELVCQNEKGAIWKDMTGLSPEDSNAWCARCLGRLNYTCKRLCVGIALDLAPEVSR